MEGEILGAAEIRVAEALVREVSQPTPQLRRRAPRVDAEEREPALARAEEECEDAQQRRLARSVRAEECESLACLDREVHPRQHPHPRVGPDEPLGHERGHPSSRSSDPASAH